MREHFLELEHKRLLMQSSLDKARPSRLRNKLGQFATPPDLANSILEHAKTLVSCDTPFRFLDPAIGTGSFYAALLRTFPPERIARAVGFEVDPYYGETASQLWSETGLDVRPVDFTRADSNGESFDLLICNPPYVRHHHLATETKRLLRERTGLEAGMRLSGLSGLYCYFLGLSLKWMSDGALACWLIPSEFMDVNYGSEVKRFLLERVTLLHLHRYAPQELQFDDALVSSAVVWFRKSPPATMHQALFSYGGSLNQPLRSQMVSLEHLRRERKWSRLPATETPAETEVGYPLSHLFRVRRGIATGDNNFFILSEDEIRSRELPFEAFRPILPSPRHLKAEVIDADSNGLPQVEQRRFLLDLSLSEDEISRRFPTLFAYLQEGKALGVQDGYLCRARSPWYSQERLSAPAILCTYMGRNLGKTTRPFRFVLNRSQAIMTNVWLGLYPSKTTLAALSMEPGLLARVCNVLNELSPERLLNAGRVYGGGLYKLEPRELGSVVLPELQDSSLQQHAQKSLLF